MLKLLDVVALVEDKPEEGSMRGQVGTIVELLAPSVYLVEFIDDEGQTYAMADLHADELVVATPDADTSPQTHSSGSAGTAQPPA